MPLPLVLPGTNVRSLAGGCIHSGLYLRGIVSRYSRSAQVNEITPSRANEGVRELESRAHTREVGDRD